MDQTSNQRAKYFISKPIDQFFIGVYDISKFVVQFFREVFAPPYEYQEVVKQCYHVGYKSLSLITLTAFITGIVFTDHSRPALADFGATSWLPSLTGIAIVKALAPLITSLICAGKVGSQIGAELGSMKVTEQIDAMEVSAVNPFKFLVVTRVLATTFMVPLLVLYSAFIGLMGSFLNVHTKDQTSFTIFIHDVLIKIIAGLMKPDKGEVKVLGKEVNKLKKKELMELRLKIGFLFQHSALYDSMTVRENLEFPMTRNMRNVTRQEMNKAVEDVLDA